jgi:hypothetical protein
MNGDEDWFDIMLWLNDFPLAELVSDGMPHGARDWLGPELDRFQEILGLNFGQTEQLGVALAHAFDHMSTEELLHRYRAIQAGLMPLEIDGYFVDGELIFEWAGYPLLVTTIELLSTLNDSDPG